MISNTIEFNNLHCFQNTMQLTSMKSQLVVQSKCRMKSRYAGVL